MTHSGSNSGSNSGPHSGPDFAADAAPPAGSPLSPTTAPPAAPLPPEFGALLSTLLAQSRALHQHLCPRQVLGARMGLYAGELLGLALPQPNKQLLTIVETDGCFADGVSVATNCWTGRRTLRVEDYGKVAATFIDTATDRAFRLAPHPAARTRAAFYAPAAPNRWEAMLHGYQAMPTAELLVAVPVTLRTPAAVLLSRPGARAVCAACGEEIINAREVAAGPRTLCRSCAAGGYWLPAPFPP